MSERIAFVFFTSRPCDRGQVWPQVYIDRAHAEKAPHRVSEIVEVRVPIREQVPRGTISTQQG